MTNNSALTLVVLASSNKGKLKELQQLLGDAVRVVSAAEMGVEMPEETEVTFAGNAALKSKAAFAQTGHISLADDSGLEVDALNGNPGVYSARYAGEDATDEQNNAKLLNAMQAVPADQRSARFRSAIAISVGNGDPMIFEGSCEGSIGTEAIGTNGFGYDPLFRLSDGQPFALLTSEQKNAISHRGAAMRLAIPALLNYLRKGAPS